MLTLDAIDSIAEACIGCRFVSAEFMYKPPPTEPRKRLVFESALRSRLSSLSDQDAVLFICNSEKTVEALTAIIADFPQPLHVATIANPLPYAGIPSSTPQHLGWEGEWERYATTDRWCRITLAMNVARRLDSEGWLIMPAHDAVWGRDLLATLVGFSHEQARGGLPAAVSPYTYYQHSQVPGADIPQDIIDILNTALGRDLRFAERLARDEVQGFWGKMGMMPFAMCGSVIDTADQTSLEDDLELDHVIRDVGYNARALWIDDPQVYRQALPVFDLEGVRTVIERTMHYSLNVPASVVGGSTLNFPLDAVGEHKWQTDPAFARNNEIAEMLIADVAADIKGRLDRFGASWVDWGAYRHVVRSGIPEVEVWRRIERGVS